VVSLVHPSLGSSYLIAHVLHSPPPPRAQLCNRYCSNKHTPSRAAVPAQAQASAQLWVPGAWYVDLSHLVLSHLLAAHLTHRSRRPCLQPGCLPCPPQYCSRPLPLRPPRPPTPSSQHAGILPCPSLLVMLLIDHPVAVRKTVAVCCSSPIA
jgi:hypothetical protein